jgi:hypothetical protein
MGGLPYGLTMRRRSNNSKHKRHEKAACQIQVNKTQQLLQGKKPKQNKI